MKAKNIILGFVAVTAIIGFGDFGPWYVNAAARPVSAIFFVLWFVLHLLENEMAAYDTEKNPAPKKATATKQPDFHHNIRAAKSA